jgi:hypothetical protein
VLRTAELDAGKGTDAATDQVDEQYGAATNQQLSHPRAQAAAAVNTPISVASAINIPTDFGHHAWVVDIQPQVNAPHR